MAVPVRLELMAWLEAQGGRLTHAATYAVDSRRQRLRDLARALPRSESLLDRPRQSLDVLSARLDNALTGFAAKKRIALTEAGGQLRPGLLTRRLADHIRRLEDRAGQLGNALGRNTRDQRRTFEARVDRLTPDMLVDRIVRMDERLAGIGHRFMSRAKADVAEWRARLESAARLNETLSYKATLARGYAVVRDADGAVVTTAKAAAKAPSLEIEFADATHKVGTVGKAAAKPAKSPEQGNLF